MTTFSVIDIDSWPIEWRVFLCSGWVALIILNYGFRTYIYNIHLPEMIQAFSRSPYISKTASMLEKQGPIARRTLIDFIFGAIKYAPKMIRLGYVSAQDIYDLPLYLKVLIYTQDMATRIAIAWSFSVLTLILIADTTN
ncbi:hypothetical protein [Pseudomonas sp. 5P_5.1_Bac1]|uniref:hypothetical protein n=1 Tax=Pseudomonas sp. 5P_5.1_Bac1 TaxID=2971616 RepID=UPI0021C8AA5A|nr:hypothetical protein [Pseudomonas sp. 5P_5.1_Bac1]MCU1723164.1 hypothetical protein [Pseudomonas sp. 5P_5.1_Bac1]